jgi:fumarate reductase flavoprotein subunit
VSIQPGDVLAGLRDQLEEASADNPNVLKGETLADIAVAIGADPAQLQQTIDRYNGFCQTGVDEDFGAGTEVLHEIGSGPYYAVYVDRFTIATIGGIDIDRNNAVLDVNGDPIPGLYSAGVESCKLYRETYNFQLSGGMNAYNFYSGRNAVRNALK